jgi:phytoene desaturase
MKIVVVGAGFGGLATAVLLSRDHEVTVFDRRRVVGGVSTKLEYQGRVFEIGPTWYLIDDLYRRFFEAAGVTPPTLVEKDPVMEFVEGKRIVVTKRNIKEIAASLGESSESVDRLFRHSEDVYESLIKAVYKDYSSFLDFLIVGTNPKIWRLFGSFHGYLRKLFRNELFIHLLEYDSLFVGTPPDKLPAMLGLFLTKTVFIDGPYWPRGGFSQMAEMIRQEAERRGVDFRLGEEVKRIKSNGDTARYVETEKSTYHADVIVVNASYPTADVELLETPSYGEKYWQRAALGPSAQLLLASGKIEAEASHLVVINEWDSHFDHLMGGPPPETPSYYIHVQTMDEPEWGPDGGHNVFILFPAAPGQEGFDERQLLKLVSKQLNAELKLHASIRPRFFYDEYRSYRYSALGLQHIMRQTAWFRPKIRHKRLRNVFFVGQSTNPGVGVPLVLTSAMLVAKNVEGS